MTRFSWILALSLITAIVMPAAAQDGNGTAIIVQSVQAAPLLLVPFEIWLLLFALTWICLGLSMLPQITGRDIWAILAAILAPTVGYLTGSIAFVTTLPAVLVNETLVTQVVETPISIPYVGWLMVGVTIIAVFNVIRVWYEVYIRPAAQQMPELTMNTSPQQTRNDQDRPRRGRP